ncbi:MAG: beta-carotene 15,15'-monooxygenase [Epsilonproteobacteria bacterium 4484_20]|nr:MAG: beta-carotene 15,15'-monooxygenase [Epsilonproteobacteria bacterium 4484_20]
MGLSSDLVHLVITVVFSFLVGMELKTYRQQFHAKDENLFFGTARTYTFIGILGYIFYRIEPVHLILYISVMVALSLLFLVLYMKKIQEGRSSILPYVVMLSVYAFGPLTERFELWMPSLLFVLIIFLLNAKQSLQRFSSDINMHEFETLGKMVLLSAVILPLLPNTHTIPYLPISPFKMWLAVVVISGISYGGYLVQKYFFPSKGYFLTGIFGGTYSSTATTVVLARKAKVGGDNHVIDAAIIAATSMMYLRLLVVATVFNFSVARSLALPFVAAALIGMLVSFVYLKRGERRTMNPDFVDKNPLELGTAFLFAGLFVLMMLVTHFVINHYGNSGLQILSFIVGFTDIDPFILSLLTGKYTVAQTELVTAIMIAAGSNNLLKAVYAVWFGGWKGGANSAVWIALLGLVTIGWALY